MNNNPDLPERWAMPPDMAKRVSDGVSKKPITPEDKLQKALDEIARDLAIIEPNPKDWGWWVSYLLDQLEEEAQMRRKRGDFKKMLESLSKSLDRMNSGSQW